MPSNIICPVCSGTAWKEKFEVEDYFLSHELFSVIECAECGLLHTSPQPENLADYYKSEEYLSHSDRKESLTDGFYHWIRNRMLARKAGWLATHTKNADPVLLDFGCGTGYFLNYMQGKNWKVLGIEAEAEARKYAAEKFNLQIQEQKEKLPADLRFTAITLWHVLEHIPDIPELLSDLTGRLTSEGILVLALPNPSSFDARFYQKFWAAWDVPRHLWHFHPAQVYLLAQRHGLKHLRTYKLPFDAFYVSMLSEKYRNASLPLIRAFWNGFRSWISTLGKPENTSSLVYVFRKN